jgi:hypothetical protein
VEPIVEVCRRNRLRWFGHVERKGDDDWVKRCTRMVVEGNRPIGRPRKTWMKTLEDDGQDVLYCSGYKGQKFMEREDSWCETTDPGKSGHTNGRAVKLICTLCLSIDYLLLMKIKDKDKERSLACGVRWCSWHLYGSIRHDSRWKGVLCVEHSSQAVHSRWATQHVGSTTTDQHTSNVDTIT